jgi:excinuclease ABC subunit A
MCSRIDLSAVQDLPSGRAGLDDDGIPLPPLSKAGYATCETGTHGPASGQTHIRIHRARVHNLKDVSLDLPRNCLIVFTGVSGSGKSSLAFDTLFLEGQRRYIESLSAYARQFIGTFEKPDVEAIEGLSPAVAIDQKTSSRNPRSTVGTVTEITDYLRLLWAKIGQPACPHCGSPIQAQLPERMAAAITRLAPGSRVQLLAPVVRGRKGEYNAMFTQLRKAGFTWVRVDGQFLRLDELPDNYRLVRTKNHDIAVVIDRLVLPAPPAPLLCDDIAHPLHARIAQGVAKALKRADGFMIVYAERDAEPPQEIFFSQHLACPQCREEGEGPEEADLSSQRGKQSRKAESTFAEMAPRLFSFNSPYGACRTCDGLGLSPSITTQRLVADANQSLVSGAIPALNKLLGKDLEDYLEFICHSTGIPTARITQPLAAWTEAERQVLFLGGTVKPLRAAGRKKGRKAVGPRAAVMDDDDLEALFSIIFDDAFGGLFELFRTLYAHGNERQKRYIAPYVDKVPCRDCKGARLQEVSLSVTLGGKNIHAVGELSLTEVHRFFSQLAEDFTDFQKTIGLLALQAVIERLGFLLDVGLGYLTLNRRAETLSGGEAQRIRLATQVGSKLSGVLYVLDEPSIGLHPYNNQLLVETLKKLVRLGNTLLVVEHDEDTIRAADWVVDVGPGAGSHGGQIVAAGPPEVLAKDAVSLTGDYLSGRKHIAVPAQRRGGSGHCITLHDAHLHNLQYIDVSFPLGTLTLVTGLSGSGKSTLVFDLLLPALQHIKDPALPMPLGVGNVSGLEHIDKVIEVDQTPIGRTPRSNPATFTGVWDLIRAVFAQTEAAKIRGFGPGRFSFNTKGGRCETCKGAGEIVLEMNFLPDVRQTCQACQGRRFDEETLSIRYRGQHIAEVLAMSVDEARGLFDNQPRIRKFLDVLCDVGLHYIRLGQPATTLSGGEAQRLKLAAEFCRRQTGRTLYLLDEPTIGLHWEDLNNLIHILNALVDQGNTVLVIEHHPDLMKVADHVIDLGPEGGAGGGRLVVAGTPEEVAACPASYTGRCLQPYLN